MTLFIAVVTIAFAITCSFASSVPEVRLRTKARPPPTIQKETSARTDQSHNHNHPSLDLVGSQGPLRTILFVDGYAYDQLTYHLKLPRGEYIHTAQTSSNNSDILTSSSVSFLSHPTDSFTFENITVINQFEGTVGVVSFVVTIRTNLDRSFKASGIYFVTGLVGTRGTNANRSVVTGISAPSVTFENPDDVIHSLPDRDVEIDLAYQPPGPDIEDDARRDPRSLETIPSITTMPSDQPSSQPFEMDPLDAALSGTGVEVQGETLGSPSHLVQWDPLNCRTLSFARLLASGNHYFSNPSCGVAYDPVLRRLLIRLQPGQSGRATVVLTLPTVPGSEESLETTVKVHVRPPPPVSPELILKKNSAFRFDYFGNEVFKLLMNKTRIPFQPENATDYILDLPNGRYARADFSKSTFNSTHQEVTFKTVPIGLEDPDTVQKLRDQLVPEETQEETPDAEATPAVYTKHDSSMIDGSLSNQNSERKSVRLRSVWDGPLTVHQDDGIGILEVSPNPSDETMEAITETHYFSAVHVAFPSETGYRTAKNVDDHKLETEIAPEDLALVSNRVNEGSKSYVEIVMQLRGYAEQNFSEHKSQQIAHTIGKMIQNFTEDGDSVELVRKQERFESLLVTFRVFVERDAREAAQAYLLNERAFAKDVAEEAFLPMNEVEVYDARAMLGKGDPKYSGAGGSPATGLSGATVGIIVVASVVLTLVMVVPIAAICFAHFATRGRISDENIRDGGNVGGF